MFGTNTLRIVLHLITVLTYDRPKNRVVKQVKVPTQEELDAYLQQANNLVAALKIVHDDPLGTSFILLVCLSSIIKNRNKNSTTYDMRYYLSH